MGRRNLQAGNGLWHRIGEALDFDRMLPTVAEVVEILQRLGADVFKHIVELVLTRIEEVAHSIATGIGRAPADAAGAQLVEMAVGPSRPGSSDATGRA